VFSVGISLQSRPPLPPRSTFMMSEPSRLAQLRENGLAFVEGASNAAWIAVQYGAA